MKIFIGCLLMLIAHNTHASTTKERVLLCQFTEGLFGEKPTALGTFKFIEEPGLLPAAKGSFHVPGENISISVRSILFVDRESKTESVQTSMTLNVEKTVITTSFSNEIDEQLSYVQIDNTGVVLCTAK